VAKASSPRLKRCKSIKVTKRQDEENDIRDVNGGLNKK
jgi:hypothetical protein